MNRRIKVIHIADKFGKAGATVHGVTRLLSWWFTRWDTSSFDVDLVGLRPQDPAFERLRSVVPNVLCLNKGKFNPTTLSAITELIRKTRADIIHLHGYGSCNFGRLAAKMTGVRVILHEHFVDPAMPPYQWLADKLLARTVDHAFGVSKSVRDFMIRERHIAADKVEVLYNGAPLGEFTPPDAHAIEAERARWKIPPDHFVLGTVGRLDPQKGNTHLLDALPQLLAKGHKITLILVGDGPLHQPLKEQAARLGIEQNVIFMGYQSNIPLLQSLMDVQVFPSLYEGTPLTLFEAMAIGKPIVSTNVDGLGELLVNDRNALVVPPKDANALAVAIDDMLTHADKRQRLAKQAKIESAQFDVQRMVDRMQEVYVQLLDQPQTHPHRRAA